MTRFDLKRHLVAGARGQLEVPADDEVIRKFLMLLEGECEGLGPRKAAQKFGFSKQRYFQIRAAFAHRGWQALRSEKRGPKTNYRRTPEVERQVIRHRFLDAEASAQVITQKLVQTGLRISIRSVERVLADYGLQKKLHTCRPRISVPRVEAQVSHKVCRPVDGDSLSIERGVRQRLADKIGDNLCGLWLLVPEHLRLGTWDLLRTWTGQPSERIEPRLALQLVHEAALCSNGLRDGCCLTIRGFEVLNGLPFLAGDVAVHDVLDAHGVAHAEELQVALGQLRRVSGHYEGQLLLIDPHRAPSFSQRHIRKRSLQRGSKPVKTAQTFFCLDAGGQPLCFTTANSSRTVSQATPELLRMAAAILGPLPSRALVAADTEHFTAELFDHVRDDTPFDLVVPMPHRQCHQRRWGKMPAKAFTRHWAGYATAVQPYSPHGSQAGPYYELVQRQAERPEDWQFHAFLSTTNRDPLETIARDYPQRWHIEEFFNFEQSLGWRRAGTVNVNIRYGQMTMALLAQTVIHQFRTRLGPPYQTWDARHLAYDIFRGLDGDIRVRDDTIIVTYYNAPNADRLRAGYQDLPAKLRMEGVDPRIPWLYDFQLDFRFK